MRLAGLMPYKSQTWGGGGGERGEWTTKKKAAVSEVEI